MRTPALVVAIALALGGCGSALSHIDDSGQAVLPVSDNAFVQLPPGRYVTNVMFPPVMAFRIFRPGWYGTQRSTGSWLIKRSSAPDADDGILIEVDYSTISLALAITRVRHTAGLITTSEPEQITFAGYPAVRFEGFARTNVTMRNPLEGFLIPEGERHVIIGMRLKGTTVFIYLGAAADVFDHYFPEAMRVANTLRFTGEFAP
jgi:hypothetical protein